MPKLYAVVRARTPSEASFSAGMSGLSGLPRAAAIRAFESSLKEPDAERVVLVRNDGHVLFDLPGSAPRTSTGDRLDNPDDRIWDMLRVERHWIPKHDLGGEG